MWHEARRRERATQKLFSDHKKRAEKRREEDRVDPSGLLQVNGVKSKININPNTHKQATNSMVVWQGDQKTTIDRFDVRATLSSLPLEDRIPERHEEGGDNERRRRPSVLDLGENEFMKKILNFERYCLIMQNDINKVPEKTRLNLVERKNDILSDAKMRKLKNNWFGTSGEASVSGDYTASDNRHLSSRSQGVSIAYEYGVTTTNVDNKSANFTNSAMVCDLDDCETELDLDCVDKIESDASNINDALNRYGLNCDEFNLLVESASRTTKEITQKLKQVKEEAKRKCEANRLPDVLNQQDYYGPSLPPDMQMRENKSSRLPVEHNSQQRKIASRESEAQIITRDDDTSHGDVIIVANSDQSSASQQAKDSIDTSTKLAPKSARQSDNLEESSRRKPSSVFRSTSSSNDIEPANVSDPNLSSAQRPGQIQINLKTAEKLEGNSNQTEIPEDKPHRVRRASTPLAYKRYCRSSRSMSRERISSSRYRSSSSSSSSSSTNSRSSISSRSNSSSSDYSRSRSRRRRVRSRSPRYRRSRRSRHRYRRKDRR